MRVVLQRVLESSVEVDGAIVGKINQGLTVLLGIQDDDNQQDIEWMANKIINMRIFNDENGVMNNSIQDVHGDILVVSQFTLMASTKKGNRPSYSLASKPNIAVPIYKDFLAFLGTIFAGKIATGQFGADMKVAIVNDGPVTIILDSKHKV
jgi:D-tyrosyl-tRNA(Tyr) deacylase